MKEGGFQGSKVGQTKRTSQGVGESTSGRMDKKALQEDLESFGFTPSLAKSEMGKEVGDKGPTYKKTKRNESG